MLYNKFILFLLDPKEEMKNGSKDLLSGRL